MSDSFRSFVEANEAWFRGVHPEPESALDSAEHTLGFELPKSLRWLLQSYGYSAAAGIDSLDETVAATVRCRSTINLPTKFVVLNDWGDAGVVVLESLNGEDPERWPVYWMGAHLVGRLASGVLPDNDCDRYDGYESWVRSRLAAAIAEA